MCWLNNTIPYLKHCLENTLKWNLMTRLSECLWVALGKWSKLETQSQSKARRIVCLGTHRSPAFGLDLSNNLHEQLRPQHEPPPLTCCVFNFSHWFLALSPWYGHRALLTGKLWMTPTHTVSVDCGVDSPLTRHPESTECARNNEEQRW